MESFNQSVIKHKAGLLNLAAELGYISKACRVMGCSGNAYFRYQGARNAYCAEAWFEASPRKPNLKNRVKRLQGRRGSSLPRPSPAHGQVRASNELRKQGIFVSPSGARSIWRHNLSSAKKAEELLLRVCTPGRRLFPEIAPVGETKHNPCRRVVYPQAYTQALPGFSLSFTDPGGQALHTAYIWREGLRWNGPCPGAAS